MIVAATGEQVHFSGHVDILYDDNGWAAIAEPGRESIWLRSFLQYHIGVGADGRRFVQEAESSERCYVSEAAKVFEHRYQTVHMDTGAEYAMKVYKCNLPLDGLQLFVQIRDLQDSCGYSFIIT